MLGRPAPRTIPARTPTIIPATDLGSVEVAKEGNLYLLTDPRGDIRLDGRGLGLYRARYAHPVDLGAAPQWRAADPPPRAVPRQWRRHHPADEPGAPAQPGRQTDRRAQPGTPGAQRDPDATARGRRPARGDRRRELLGGDRGDRHRARPRRGHGRHLRGAWLSPGCPRHALPGRDPRRPDRVRLRRARRDAADDHRHPEARQDRGRRGPGRMARSERRRALERHGSGPVAG